jgi:hypothetical protein
MRNARAACPEGNECGSLFRYMLPQRPSGLRRRMANLRAMTQAASTEIDTSMMMAHCFQNEAPAHHRTIIAAPQNHESPECAKTAAALRNGPGFSAMCRRDEIRASSWSMAVICIRWAGTARKPPVLLC